MGAKTDIIKGRVEEAAGVLTGNEKLREDGRTDQAVGRLKETAQQVVDATKKAADTAIDKVKAVAKKLSD